MTHEARTGRLPGETISPAAEAVERSDGSATDIRSIRIDVLR